MANIQISQFPINNNVSNGATTLVTDNGNYYQFNLLTITGTNNATGSFIQSGTIIAGTGIILNTSGNYIIINYNGPQLYYGSGNPNGVVLASIGSIYSDTFNHVQYNKFSGQFSSTGWF